MPDFTLDQIVVAYHRAKVDLYYASESRLFDMLEYEENIEANLEWLVRRLNGNDEEWVQQPGFVGTYTLAPKGVDIRHCTRTNSFHWSDPASAWRALVLGAAGNRPTAEFRVMSLCSIGMHVLSTLWMQTAGAKMEAALGPEAMGSRLKRTRSGNLNTRAPGSFQHYYRPYGQWRDRGLAAMTAALDLGDSVIALTADVESFYHKLNPDFLLESEFTDRVLHIELSPDEQKLNRLFVASLRSWSEYVAAEGGWTARGLPVGLPASAVVANLALVELDRIIVEEIQPLYYGRYVDDVILVMKDGPRFSSQRGMWHWIIDRSRGLLREVGPSAGSATGNVIHFAPGYLSSSEVAFANGKNKTFLLDGESGRSLVGSIKKTIDERASEWRSFTPVRDSPAAVGADLVVATNIGGENAATLRDADQISTRRSAFAIKLRDFEAYGRDLDPQSWIPQREAFFNAVCSNVVVLPKFFELATYLPRVLQLAAACGDTSALRRLFDSVGDVFDAVLSDCDISIKAYPTSRSATEQVAVRWGEQLVRLSIEGLASGLSTWPRAATLDHTIRPLRPLASAARTSLPGVQRLRDLHGRLFNRDLGHVPYRFAFLNPEIAPQVGLPSSLAALGSVALPVAEEVRQGLNALVHSLQTASDPKRLNLPKGASGSDVPGLLFATRPPNVWELFLALRGQNADSFGFASVDTIQQILAAVRGFTREQNLPRIRDTEYGIPTLSLAGGPRGGSVRFALAMIHTSVESLKGAALGRPDLHPLRYESFKTVLNEATTRPGHTDYIVLPELALPSRWFVPFAHKLRQAQASLIAGIEYIPTGRDAVHNEVWASLRSGSSDGVGYLVYPQDKQRAAPNEEPMLHALGQLRLEPKVVWAQPHPHPPVIAHGDFRFAMLICSELTNIKHRAALRGHVDALVVPEWNPDLHTFEALVESAALDMHAYIIQVNCRLHGDTRIRAPRRKDWDRDVVRLRGGTHDYVVIGELDYWALREHHSLHRQPDAAFKPVPDGFAVAPVRKRLPRAKKGNKP